MHVNNKFFINSDSIIGRVGTVARAVPFAGSSMLPKKLVYLHVPVRYVYSPVHMDKYVASFMSQIAARRLRERAIVKSPAFIACMRLLRTVWCPWIIHYHTMEISHGSCRVVASQWSADGSLHGVFMVDKKLGSFPENQVLSSKGNCFLLFSHENTHLIELLLHISALLVIGAHSVPWDVTDGPAATISVRNSGSLNIASWKIN